MVDRVVVVGVVTVVGVQCCHYCQSLTRVEECRHWVCVGCAEVVDAGTSVVCVGCVDCVSALALMRNAFEKLLSFVG